MPDRTLTAGVILLVVLSLFDALYPPLFGVGGGATPDVIVISLALGVFTLIALGLWAAWTRSETGRPRVAHVGCRGRARAVGPLGHPGLLPHRGTYRSQDRRRVRGRADHRRRSDGPRRTGSRNDPHPTRRTAALSRCSAG